ncbi:hypothetical protein [Tateyamaria sp. Alg231-49]|uniref:hypothetical protein n=1 Tax=Tateyamaria sp. Alg231-49 TaxID=1922219 RepID=UPI00131EF902|nr:hypothetical protein [Tateyamaria sp. Alg231-49]
MTAPQISWEELRHIKAGAIAICRTDPARYSDARVLFAMDAKGGEAAIVFGDHVDDYAKQIASLVAVGPLAKLADQHEIVKVMQKGTDREIQKAGDLSGKDMQLFAEYTKSDTLPCAVVLGVYHLEQKLGVSRFRKLAKALRDASNQSLVPDRGWPLEDIVPQAVAASAARKAKATLAGIMNPAPAGETAAENAARLQAEHDAKQAKKQREIDAAHAAERASFKTKRKKK